jgi:hypothetical protein
LYWSLDHCQHNVGKHNVDYRGVSEHNAQYECHND